VTLSRLPLVSLSPARFNFRDVGGLRTHDGAKVRPGVLLRSAQLSGLDATGHGILRELGVTDVHDLRGLREIDHIGHDKPARRGAVEHHPRSIPGWARRRRTTRRPDPRWAHMLEVYRMFPALPEAHLAIVAIAESVARAARGAVLVHCAAGKDRTGWAIATVLRAVEVTEEDVLTDFFCSATTRVPSLRAMMSTKPGRGPRNSPTICSVSGKNTSVSRWSRCSSGTVSSRAYLSAIGFTDELRALLRERLLE